MIYFDNAATTGHKPQNVITAVNNALKFYSAIKPVRGGKRRVCIRRSTIDETSSSKIIEANVLATMHTREKKRKLSTEDAITN